ncbi:MAG TPA: dihydroorotase [Acidimicrobiia bacterium]|nr:dihydroorotase [Acidimicrobiia bacterium]
MIVIQGGSVVTSDGIITADVAVDDGCIQAIGHTDVTDAVRVDASGCWVGPGLVDLHVHLREPGQEWKEDIDSGSRAAAVGGFTAVVAMPNTLPAIDMGHRARFVSERGRQVGRCQVVAAGSITLDRAGTALAHLDELIEAGVRVFTDDGDTLVDAGLLRRAMEYLAGRDCVVAQHAEDPGLAGGGHMHEGSVSSRLGIKGLPALAEETIIARDLALVELTGAPYHVQHVSTAGTVDLLRRAKAAGLPVTAEVTPHHLTFDHTEVESMDPDFKMYPPLRTADDVAELRRALADGTIDAVATDHAPHADHEQEVPFEEAPRGVVGLETAVAATLTVVGLDQAGLFERMSTAPARIARLGEHGRPLEVGGPAHITVIDPTATWMPDRFSSRSQNSPFRGRKLTGRVMATIFGGTVTHQVTQ